MNFELYIIGSRGGFEILPEDGNDKIFRQCAAMHKNTETLVIAQDWDIMHYLYFHQIGKRKDFLGIGISFNGCSFNSTQAAFDVLEHLFTTAVCESLMVRMNNDGQVVFNPEAFHEQSAQYNRLCQEAQLYIDEMPRGSFGKKSTSYHYGRGETSISFEGGDEAVFNALSNNDYVAVVRHGGGEELSDLQGRMRQLQEEKTELTQRYNEVLKKKKQYSTVVILLSTLIVGAGIAAFVIYKNYNTIGFLKGNVTVLEQDVESKRETITKQNVRMATLEESSQKQKNRILQLIDSVAQAGAMNDLYSDMTHTVGLPPITSDNFDYGYSMWLFADYPMTITSIWLRANRSGSVRIVLRDQDGSFVDDETVSVYDYFSPRSLSLSIPHPGYYSLSVDRGSNIKLQYTSTNKTIYRSFGSSALNIIGCCSQGNGYADASTGYYQYFYSIHYKVRL